MGFNANTGNSISDDAFDEEIEKLERLELLTAQKAAFATKEGQGVSREAEINLGDATDLEDLSDEEREARSSGRVSTQVGLFL